MPTAQSISKGVLHKPAGTIAGFSLNGPEMSKTVLFQAHPVLVLCSENTPHNDLKTFIHGVNQGCPLCASFRSKSCSVTPPRRAASTKDMGGTTRPKACAVSNFSHSVVHHARGSHSTCYMTLPETHTYMQNIKRSRHCKGVNENLAFACCVIGK